MTTRIDRQTFALTASAQSAVAASLADWQAGNKVQRVWSRDASVWTSADEDRWLGWLAITDDQIAQLESLQKAAAEIKAEGFAHVLLLGMGGSSLCPEVLRLTFGRIPGYPELHILDSTDPAQIRSIEKRLDFARTLFIVSSKSGGTLEPNIFKQYFYERVKTLLGAAEAGRRFIAVTDPGSNMQRVAERDGFRKNLLWSSGDRRPVLGALSLRDGPRRDHGSRRRTLSSRHEGNGRRVRPGRPGG